MSFTYWSEGLPVAPVTGADSVGGLLYWSEGLPDGAVELLEYDYVPAGNLQLSKFAPTLTLTENRSIEVPSANLTLSTFAPLYGVGFTREILSGDLLLSSSAPTLVLTDNHNITVSSADLVLTTDYADELEFIPPYVNLALNSFAPNISRTDSASIEVPAGNLRLTTSPPFNLFVLEWPFTDCPISIKLDIVADSGASGGRSLTGSRQYVQVDAGYWMITLGGLRIRSNEDVLTWRNLETALDGRAGRINVPSFDRKRRPIPSVNAAADGDVALGATTMLIAVDTGDQLEEGMHFSTNGRMYRIRSIESTPGAASYEVTFRPPTREPIYDGTPLDFDNPTCRCRLASDDAMDVDLELLMRATPTLSFIEDP